MLSPLQLDKFWLEELLIQAIPLNADSGASPAYLIDNIDFDVQSRRSKPSYRIRLIVEIIAEAGDKAVSGYRRIRIVIWGQFSFFEDTQEELIEQMTPYNQIAILYGIARGIVMSATGVTLNEPFLLPSVNFIDIVAEKAARMEVESQSASEPSHVNT